MDSAKLARENSISSMERDRKTYYDRRLNEITLERYQACNKGLFFVDTDFPLNDGDKEYLKENGYKITERCNGKTRVSW